MLSLGDKSFISSPARDKLPTPRLAPLCSVLPVVGQRGKISMGKCEWTHNVFVSA